MPSRKERHERSPTVIKQCGHSVVQVAQPEAVAHVLRDDEYHAATIIQQTVNLAHDPEHPERIIPLGDIVVIERHAVGLPACHLVLRTLAGVGRRKDRCVQASCRPIGKDVREAADKKFVARNWVTGFKARDRPNRGDVAISAAAERCMGSLLPILRVIPRQFGDVVQRPRPQIGDPARVLDEPLQRHTRHGKAMAGVAEASVLGVSDDVNKALVRTVQGGGPVHASFCPVSRAGGRWSGAGIWHLGDHHEAFGASPSAQRDRRRAHRLTQLGQMGNAVSDGPSDPTNHKSVGKPGFTLTGKLSRLLAEIFSKLPVSAGLVPLPYFWQVNGKMTQFLTLGQAAAAVGVTRTAVWQALHSGSLPASKDGTGRWQIDPTALQARFAARLAKQQLAGKETWKVASKPLPDGWQVAINLLQERVALLEAEIAALRPARLPRFDSEPSESTAQSEVTTARDWWPEHDCELLRRLRDTLGYQSGMRFTRLRQLLNNYNAEAKIKRSRKAIQHKLRLLTPAG